MANRPKRQPFYDSEDDDDDDDLVSSAGPTRLQQRQRTAYRDDSADAGRDGQPPAESLVAFGTAQTAIEAFVPLWKQEVRDEQGGKRLHGAFKGGFSAGYFNTVGSKEGWQPATFQSSRSQRVDRKQMQATDFMDEEDLEEIRDSSRLSTKAEYADLGLTAGELAKRAVLSTAQGFDNVTQHALLAGFAEALVLPASESYGVKLLRQMGWRQGQGLGPRVLRKNEDDAFVAKMKFAPIQDTPIISHINKSDYYGLGHVSLISTTSRRLRQVDGALNSKPHSALPMQGSIGIGVLNEGDDDALDGNVYENIDANALYDISHTQQEEREKQYIQRKAALRVASETTAAAKQAISLSSTQFIPPQERCVDGTRPLAGFVLAEKGTSLIKMFFPPSIPPGWKSTIVNSFNLSTPKSSSEHGQSSSQKLSSSDRAKILGEELLDAPSRSVFDLLKPSDRNRLRSMSSSQQEKVDQQKKEQLLRVSKNIAETALRGYIPFQHDIPKQIRYRRFLEVCAGLKTELLPHPMSVAGDDTEKELADFVKAAQIFQPMSDLMAMKFTSATVIEANEVKGGIQPRTTQNDLQQPTVIETPTDPSSAAAHMGMFGWMTRTEQDFYPTRLLCKRFNVPTPHSHHKDTGDEPHRTRDRLKANTSIESTKELLNADTMRRILLEHRGANTMSRTQQNAQFTDEIFSVQPHTSVSYEVNKPASVELTELKRALELKALEEQAEIVEPVFEPTISERPSMDIFREVFGDSEPEEFDQPVALSPKIVKSPTTTANTISAPRMIDDNYVREENISNKVDITVFKPVFKSRNERQTIGKGTIANTSIPEHQQPLLSDQSTKTVMDSNPEDEDAPVVVHLSENYMDASLIPLETNSNVQPHIIAREFYTSNYDVLVNIDNAAQPSSHLLKHYRYTQPDLNIDETATSRKKHKGDRKHREAKKKKRRKLSSKSKSKQSKRHSSSSSSSSSASDKEEIVWVEKGR